VDAVVAGAPLVQNRIPQGSNWDGADDIERDEASYQQLLREREQPAPTASTPGGAGPLAPPAVTAPAAAPRTTAVAAPGARGSRG